MAAPSLFPQPRTFGFQLIEHNDSLRLFPLRLSGYTWAQFVLMLILLFLAYKGWQIDVPWEKIACVGLFMLLATGFMYGILTRLYDGVVITKDRITYRYGLIGRSVPLERRMEVQIRQSTHRWTSDGDEQVEVTVELWLVHPTRSHHLFDFHSDKEADAGPMRQLAERLRALIQDRIG